MWESIRKWDLCVNRKWPQDADKTHFQGQGIIGNQGIYKISVDIFLVILDRYTGTLTYS